MQLQVKTKRRIGKPVQEVFDAVINPAKMSQYFISEASGPMEEGKTINWTWADYNATAPIHVQKVEPNRYIAFTWGGSGMETLVEMEFTAEAPDITSILVREKGWNDDEKGIARLAEQTQGWVDMLLCLKAFVQFGVNLRKV